MIRIWNWFWELSLGAKVAVSLILYWFIKYWVYGALITNAFYYYDRHALVPLVPEVSKSEFPKFSFQQREAIKLFAQARDALENNNTALAEDKLDLVYEASDNTYVRYAIVRYYLSVGNYEKANRGFSDRYSSVEFADYSEDFPEFRVIVRRDIIALNTFNAYFVPAFQSLGFLATDIVEGEREGEFSEVFAQMGFISSFVRPELSEQQFKIANESCVSLSENCEAVNYWHEAAKDPIAAGLVSSDADLTENDNTRTYAFESVSAVLLGRYFDFIGAEDQALNAYQVAINEYSDIDNIWVHKTNFAFAMTRAVEILYNEGRNDEAKQYIPMLLGILNESRHLIDDCNYYCRLYERIDAVGAINGAIN